MLYIYIYIYIQTDNVLYIISYFFAHLKESQNYLASGYLKSKYVITDNQNDFSNIRIT